MNLVFVAEPILANPSGIHHFKLVVREMGFVTYKRQEIALPKLRQLLPLWLRDRRFLPRIPRRAISVLFMPKAPAVRELAPCLLH